MRNTSRSIWRRIASDGAAFSVEPRHLPAGSVAASIRSFLQALNWIVHKSASITAADARAGSRSEISVAKRLAHAGTSRPKNEVFCLFADRESRVFGYSSRPAGRGTSAAQRPLHPPRRMGHIVLRRWQSARVVCSPNGRAGRDQCSPSRESRTTQHSLSLSLGEFLKKRGIDGLPDRLQ